MFPAPRRSRSPAPGWYLTPSSGIAPFPPLPHPSHSGSEPPSPPGLPSRDCNAASTAKPTNSYLPLYGLQANRSSCLFKS